VRVIPSDERDCYWEEHAPVFRVYLFRGPGPGYSVETYDVSEADVGEVMGWAQNEAGPDRQWAVTLVRDTQPDGTPSRGLIWLVGRDLNEVPPDNDPRRSLHY
jgi:hypothetical protein